MRLINQYSFSHQGYGFAIALSFLVHFAFVATLEAAVLLTKKLDLPVPPSLVTIRVLPHDVLKVQNRKTTPDTSLRTKVEKKNQEEKYQNESKQAGPSRNEKIAKGQAPPLGRKVRSFERSQTNMDKRIQDFEIHLADLVSKKKEIISDKMVAFDVFDLEKVPVQAREDLFSSYLKRMRARVAKFWAGSVESLGKESSLAVIQYRIFQDGRISVLSSQLIHGSESFRQMCLAALDQAGPFEPLPFHFDSSVKNQYLTVALTFYFRKDNPGKGILDL